MPDLFDTNGDWINVPQEYHTFVDSGHILLDLLHKEQVNHDKMRSILLQALEELSFTIRFNLPRRY